MQNIIDYLRKTVWRDAYYHVTDAELLKSFLASKDNDAFASLVRRHGLMVLGVARRVLGHWQDAEDVFQATFLVLVRKAKSIKKGHLLGNWLYGVAYRTALEARTQRSRRRCKETHVDHFPEPSVGDSRERPEPDLLPLLDQELSQLSEKYRVPVILCDLEGRSRKEVASELQIPEGTLSSRLATARKQLARRFARLGITVGGAAVSISLPHVASARVPALLTSNTIHSAIRMAHGITATPERIISLVDGVTKTMFLTNLKSVVATTIAVSLVGFALGVPAIGWFRSTSKDQLKEETQTVDEPLPNLGGVLANVAQPKKENLPEENIRDIWDTHNTNAALFDLKYANKRMTFKGSVGAIRKPPDGFTFQSSYLLDLTSEQKSDHGGLWQVTFVFPNHDDEVVKALAGLKVSQIVSLDGNCQIIQWKERLTGQISWILCLTDAKILSIEK